VALTIDSSRSSSLETTTAADDTSPSTPSLSPPPVLTGSASEAFQGNWYSPPAASLSHEAEVPAVATHELQTLQAKTLADRVGLRDGLEQPIADLLKKGHLAGPDSPAWGRFENALSRDPVKGSLGQLSRSAATDIIGADVRKAIPDASPDRQADITQKLVGRVQDQLLYSGVSAFRDQTVKTLEDRAGSLSTLAKDPKQVNTLERSLVALDKGTGVDRQKADALRARLGVEGKGPLMKELRESAANIRDVARDLQTVSGDRIFRSLNGFEGRDELMKRAGIAPGSWAAQALANGQAKGVSEQKNIEHLETVLKWSTLAASGPAGVVAEALISVPEVGVAREEASRARAAEASGVMPAGSAKDAHWNADVKTGIAVAGVVGGPLISKGFDDGLAHVAPVAAKLLGARGMELVSEAAAKAGFDVAEHSLLRGE
jgi:hypothetical protein